MNKNVRDLLLRFVLGGSAVAACYIMIQLIPWKSFGGIFAAFPAVMAAAVIMAGIFQGSEHAAEVAMGAIAGMMGCMVCVSSAYLFMLYTGKWGLALSVSLLAWFLSSYFFMFIINRIKSRRAA